MTKLPNELLRNYQVFIAHGPNAKKHSQKMREIKSQQIGSLVTIRGIVTRASDVKPCIQVAVYACDVCGYEVYQVVNTREFNPKVECPSSKCVAN
jgi:DNA replication licensing factor MCM7